MWSYAIQLGVRTLEKPPSWFDTWLVILQRYPPLAHQAGLEMQDAISLGLMGLREQIAELWRRAALGVLCRSVILYGWMDGQLEVCVY